MTSPPATRPDWLTPELFPFKSRFLSLEGHVVHYVDEGRGPILLMLHGNPTWSFAWRHLILALRDRFRCVALDYPGFGLSVAKDGYDHRPESHAKVVASFVEALDLRDVTPVVQDWGGPIGLWVSGRVPERVKALVIGNTMAWPVDDDPHFVRFSSMMGGPIGGFFIRHFNAFVNVMIPMGTPKRKVGKDAMRAYRLPLATPERREASRVFPWAIVGSTPFLRETEAGLARLVDKPVLLCWGTKDIAFREKERLRFEKTFPRARTTILEGAGHYVQEDAPDEIATAIGSFFTEVVRAGGAS
ncbi:MAG: alpha/beta fold hydrolase [Sandaracinaceae bacterium]|nr:alpha/beta fold hydrolase [Sandaracinaceae bacterium]